MARYRAILVFDGKNAYAYASYIFIKEIIFTYGNKKTYHPKNNQNH